MSFSVFRGTFIVPSFDEIWPELGRQVRYEILRGCDIRIIDVQK